MSSAPQPEPDQIWVDGDGVWWRVVAVKNGWAWVRRHGHPRSPALQTNPAWFEQWTFVRNEVRDAA